MSEIQIPDFLAIAEKLKSDVRAFAKVFCLQWFDDSFQNQGFTDGSFQAWQKRKEPDKRAGAAIMIDTTFLRKSLAVLGENETQMEFGTHVPYAGVHNNGERIRAIRNVRAYHNKNFMGKGKRVQIKAHTRKVDFTMPKRQFIGESQLLMEGLDNWFLKELEKRFKQ